MAKSADRCIWSAQRGDNGRFPFHYSSLVDICRPNAHTTVLQNSQRQYPTGILSVAEKGNFNQSVFHSNDSTDME